MPNLRYVRLQPRHLRRRIEAVTANLQNEIRSFLERQNTVPPVEGFGPPWLEPMINKAFIESYRITKASYEHIRRSYYDALCAYAEHFGFSPESVGVTIDPLISMSNRERGEIPLMLQMPAALYHILTERGLLP